MVGCVGYREIPLILGVPALVALVCGRFGATVVLHARCTSKITHHLRSDGSSQRRTQQNPEESSSTGAFSTSRMLIVSVDLDDNQSVHPTRMRPHGRRLGREPIG
jgi:hypothetical protein